MQFPLALLWACVVQPCEYFSDKAEHLELARLYSGHCLEELSYSKVKAATASLRL